MVVVQLHLDDDIGQALHVVEDIQAIDLVVVDLDCHNYMVVLDVDHMVAYHLDLGLERIVSMEGKSGWLVKSKDLLEHLC